MGRGMAWDLSIVSPKYPEIPKYRVPEISNLKSLIETGAIVVGGEISPERHGARS